MKRIGVLGSTGSIGTQTLDVARHRPESFKITALAAGANVDLLEQQTREFRPAIVGCGSEAAATELQKRLGRSFTTITTDMNAVASYDDTDLVVGGLPGSAGLEPTFAAVRAGKDIALATKEVLVIAGRLFMRSVRDNGVRLLPVDSEQSAIFQCLQGYGHLPFRRIILTASGGPFRNMTRSELSGVTPEQALHHPRWKMGRKVTVDSATLMNKGLEVIEAAWLFEASPDQIEVVIHPQSIVHSMVEFMDGSIIAQLGPTDMRIPISYAMAYPERTPSGVEPLDFVALGSLTFERPDILRFPLLKAAYDTLRDSGGSAAVVYNAADEVAVDLFLAGKIAFDAIPVLVLAALEKIGPRELDSLEAIMAFHREVTDYFRSKWL